MPANEQLEQLASQLDGLAESLADAAMDILREALSAEDEPARLRSSKKEKVVSRARSATEKAARLLREAAET